MSVAAVMPANTASTPSEMARFDARLTSARRRGESASSYSPRRSSTFGPVKRCSAPISGPSANTAARSIASLSSATLPWRNWSLRRADSAEPLSRFGGVPAFRATFASR